MKTTFSYFPGMFEKLKAKCYFKKQNQNYYEISNIYKCGER